MDTVTALIVYANAASTIGLVLSIYALARVAITDRRKRSTQRVDD